jgi:hypothetical protein
MASSGPNSPSTAVNNAALGSFSWNNPTNCLAEDGAMTHAGAFGGAGYTQYLDSSGFGFSIPSGATIDGIVVEVKLRANINDYNFGIEDGSIRLLKAGTLAGSNKARGTGVRWSTVNTYVTFGGVADLWGTTWTDSDINNSGFGFSLLALVIDNAKGGVYAYVDHIRITVYYTAGGEGGSTSASSLLLAGD